MISARRVAVMEQTFAASASGAMAEDRMPPESAALGLDADASVKRRQKINQQGITLPLPKRIFILDSVIGARCCSVLVLVCRSSPPDRRI